MNNKRFAVYRITLVLLGGMLFLRHCHMDELTQRITRYRVA